MAKRTGLKLRGTINNITFYKWGDEYYVRRKSSLTGKRVKTDTRFRQTMVYASLLAEGSKTASASYRLINDEKKNVTLCRQITGRAMRWLKQGKEKNYSSLKLN